MNLWLHKEVMKKLADNGGKVPQDLLSCGPEAAHGSGPVRGRQGETHRRTGRALWA